MYKCQAKAARLRLGVIIEQVVSAAAVGRNLAAHTVRAPALGSYFWRVDSYLRGKPSGTPRKGTVFEFVVIDTDADGLPRMLTTFVDNRVHTSQF